MGNKKIAGMVPFQITFLDFPESDSVWMAVQKRIEKIEHFFDRITRHKVKICERKAEANRI